MGKSYLYAQKARTPWLVHLAHEARKSLIGAMACLYLNARMMMMFTETRITNEGY
jgi:hypothetical protein